MHYVLVIKDPFVFFVVYGQQKIKKVELNTLVMKDSMAQLYFSYTTLGEIIITYRKVRVVQ